MTTALAPRARSRRWKPPPSPRPWLDFARTVKLPDGPHAGEYWNPASEPVQEAWMGQLQNPYWRVRICVAPSQRGKTLAAVLTPTLYALTERRQSVCYILPTLDKLSQNWEGKIKPSIEGMGFGAWLPTKGPGAKGGRPAALVVRDPATGARAGLLYFMAGGGGGKETALSSVTASPVVIDEGDDFQSEGHLLLGLKRGASYGDDAEALIASTVNDRLDRTDHPILAVYARGTASRVWFQCPHCADIGPSAGFQLLEWTRVTFDASSAEAARDTARYVCQHCAVAWTEADRRRALRHWRLVHRGQTVNEAGTVTGPVPLGRWFSLLSTGLDYYMDSLPNLVADYWAAQVSVSQRADHSAMRLFHYKVLCQAYDGDKGGEENAQKITVEYLQVRAAHSPWGPTVASTDREADGDRRTYSRHVAEFPREAAFGAVAVDVQGDRCYWLLLGLDHERRQWDVAWGYEYATPDRQPMNEAQLHQVLDRIDGITNGICDRIACRGVDTNFNTDHIVRWLRMHPDWVPTYGASADKARRMQTGGSAEATFPGILIQKRSANWSLPQHRHHIDTNPMRKMAQNAFLGVRGDPGSAMLPNGLKQNASDRNYLQHLCGEEWDEKKGKWVPAKGGSRHDFLDCRVYALSLGFMHLEMINFGKPVAPMPLPEPSPGGDWVHADPRWSLGGGENWNLN